MISTAVKLQTTNVLSLQHSILSEPCNVNLYGLLQHNTCFTTLAKVIWSKADSGGNFFVQQRSTFCPTHLYFPFLYILTTLLTVLSCIINIWKCKKLVATVVVFINKICTCPTMVGGSLSGVIAVQIQAAANAFDQMSQWTLWLYTCRFQVSPEWYC